MSDPVNRLFDLLPAHYRARDGENGPLRQVLAILAEQFGRVEDDLQRWYRNWFIETCEDWAVPYIGDLIAVVPVTQVVDVSRLDPSAVQRLRRAESPRTEVADTVRRRRRKGLLHVLEELAFALTGRAGVAVEFRRLLSQTQDLRSVRPEMGRRISLRDGDGIEHLSGPFDQSARTADVRNIASTQTPGRFAPRSVGLFVFPWTVHTVSRAPARVVRDGTGCHFTFDVLGRDVPLFNHPTTPGAQGEQAAPVPIRRRALRDHPSWYYGARRSIRLWRRPPDVDTRPCPYEVIPRTSIISGDLSGWAVPADTADDQVVIDPQLGRIAFPPMAPQQGITCSYAYGFSDDIGGGEYPRETIEPRTADFYRVVSQPRPELREFATLAEAIDTYMADRAANGLPNAIIEIGRSGVCLLPSRRVEVPEGQSLQLRARAGVRALVRTGEKVGDWHFSGGPNSVLTLDGLLVFGSRLRIAGGFELIRVRHCTLSPCEVPPARCAAETGARLFGVDWDLNGMQARVEIDRTILGPCALGRDAVTHDPAVFVVRDSVWNANTSEDAVFRADCSGFAHAMLTAERVTALGPVLCHTASATNCVFDGPLRVSRRQIGCLRFCYVPQGSRPPRRYECVEAPPPLFVSRQFSDPGYARLTDDCPPAIRRGAEDFSEMGAFHDLFWPQRLAALQTRLEESVPVGVSAAVLPTVTGTIVERQRAPQ